MPDMDLGDVTIHYEDAGTGPFAYVYCHGMGANGQGFVEEFGFWRQHFPRVITWDNRGLGQSGKAVKYNLPLYAQDLDRLLDKLGVQRALVHGLSWGGVVAQQFGLDYPDRCAALIIDSSSSEVNQAASEGWYQRGERVRLAAKEGAAPAAAAPSAPLAPQVKPEHVDSWVAEARVNAGLREFPLTPRLKNIKCPVLVTSMDKDTVAGTGGSVIIARNIPGSRIEIVEGTGHGVHKVNPQRFRAVVLDWAKAAGLNPT